MNRLFSNWIAKVLLHWGRIKSRLVVIKSIYSIGRLVIERPIDVEHFATYIMKCSEKLSVERRWRTFCKIDD